MTPPPARVRLLGLALLAFALAPVIVAQYALAMDSIPVAETPTPSAWPDDALTMAYLGHASLLMNYFGVRVLSDPSLLERVGLSIDSILTIGPKRHTPPPLSAGQLGRIDVLLLTHAHMDHVDIPSIRKLPRDMVVVACEKCSRLVAPLGFKDVRELRWGEETEVRGLKIRAMGANHWGKRWPPYGVNYGFKAMCWRDGQMLLACIAHHRHF